MPDVASSPCRKGHTEGRNRHGQCVACLRLTRAAYRKKQPKVEVIPEDAVPVIPSPEDKPAPGTFLAVAREWLAEQDNLAPGTSKKRQYALKQLRPLWQRPVAEIKTPEYVDVLKAIEAEGDRRETAHRCAMLVSAVCRFAKNRGYVEFPGIEPGQMKGTLRPVKVASHPAITEPKAFGAMLRAIDLYVSGARSRNHPSVGVALTLAPLLFVRPGELRSAEWSEINLDKAEWLIPGEKMKMRRPHLVPLSKQALAIFGAQQLISGNGKYCFPQKGNRDEAISENAFREAFRVIELISPDKQSMHGFRASASTLLNGELGFDSALVELQLAHAKRDKIAATYDRSQRIPERRAMMQRWADYLDELKAAAAKA